MKQKYVTATMTEFEAIDLTKLDITKKKEHRTMASKFYTQLEFRSANWQLNTIVTDQMFIFALIGKFRCFSCSNLRWLELKVKKTNSSQQYTQSLTPKKTSITNLSNQILSWEEIMQI